MEEIVKALVVSIAEGGPLYAGVVLAGVLFVWKVWPSIDRRMKSAEDRDDRAEQRRAEAEQHRAKQDREMAELNGKWLVVSEQSSRAMEAMTEQMQVLNATLQDSKAHSREMGERINEIHAAVVPRVPESTD